MASTSIVDKKCDAMRSGATEERRPRLEMRIHRAQVHKQFFRVIFRRPHFVSHSIRRNSRIGTYFREDLAFVFWVAFACTQTQVQAVDTVLA